MVCPEILELNGAKGDVGGLVEPEGDLAVERREGDRARHSHFSRYTVVQEGVALDVASSLDSQGLWKLHTQEHSLDVFRDCFTDRVHVDEDSGGVGAAEELAHACFDGIFEETAQLRQGFRKGVKGGRSVLDVDLDNVRVGMGGPVGSEDSRQEEYGET